MKQRRRIYYTDSQKALMWERWRKGESLQQIAQLFDRNHSSVQGILAETGGHTAKATAPFELGTNPCRAGGDLALSGCWRFDSRDCDSARTCSVHH
ncbi:hypothetical protein EMIT0111MI5_11397 [Burkholderia sp. IT-111MI5]